MTTRTRVIIDTDPVCHIAEFFRLSIPLRNRRLKLLPGCRRCCCHAVSIFCTVRRCGSSSAIAYFWERRGQEVSDPLKHSLRQLTTLSCLRNVVSMFHVIEKELRWRADNGRAQGFESLRKFKPIVTVGAEKPLADQIVMADYFRKLQSNKTVTVTKYLL